MKIVVASSLSKYKDCLCRIVILNVLMIHVCKRKFHLYYEKEIASEPTSKKSFISKQA